VRYTRQTCLCRVPTCAECLALGKGALCREPNFTECDTRQSRLCRVPDKRHSAKNTTLGKASDSGSATSARLCSVLPTYTQGRTRANKQDRYSPYARAATPSRASAGPIDTDHPTSHPPACHSLHSRGWASLVAAPVMEMGYAPCGGLVPQFCLFVFSP
jgi:hypothetical protein